MIEIDWNRLKLSKSQWNDSNKDLMIPNRERDIIVEMFYNDWYISNSSSLNVFFIFIYRDVDLFYRDFKLNMDIYI